MSPNDEYVVQFEAHEFAIDLECLRNALKPVEPDKCWCGQVHKLDNANNAGHT